MLTTINIAAWKRGPVSPGVPVPGSAGESGSTRSTTMRERSATVVHRIPLTKARHNLGAVIKRVHVNKEYFILERDGIPVAGLMDVDELEDYLDARDPKVREEIRKSNEDIRAGRTRPVEEFLAELGQTGKPVAKTSRRRKE